ncbi:hypothetical protein BofuT4_P060980.1 [Botrytis cinerea T4]|uniref:Uncharacterized protein n=1 Tax=Botryotinia fuckeliana (strain T4) TaxID=999810 RepID=G2XTR8_BOTF4|nr:hypothetical protein BofuT4_P060980.1 [Botrytis cinerea T4]
MQKLQLPMSQSPHPHSQKHINHPTLDPIPPLLHPSLFTSQYPNHLWRSISILHRHHHSISFFQKRQHGEQPLDPRTSPARISQIPSYQPLQLSHPDTDPQTRHRPTQRH